MTGLFAAWPIWLGLFCGAVILGGAVSALLIHGARDMQPVCNGRCDGGDPDACTCIGDCGRPGCHGPWNTVQLIALRDEDGSHG